MIIRIYFTAILLGIALVGCTEQDYEQWDLNADDMLDSTEFYTGVGETGIYETWTADTSGADTSATDSVYMGEAGDSLLSEEALRRGLESYGAFEKLDTDSSGYLEAVEFEEYFSSTGDYSAWDVDADSMVSPDEMYTGLYETLNADGNEGIAREEFYGGVFRVMDTDESESLDREEFQRALMHPEHEGLEPKSDVF